MRHIYIGFFLVLVACSGPMDTPLPSDLTKMESIKPAMEKLKPEDRDLLAAYIVRHTFGAAMGAAFGVKGEPIPPGMTIGKAIAAQRSFMETAKALEATQKLEAERIAAAKKALSDQMIQLLSARLVDLTLHKATYQDFDVENYVKLAIEFQNKGSKTISGLKGLAVFKDKFGDTVSELPIKVEQEISAGKTITVDLQKRYNQFNTEDQKLANLSATTAKFSISPEVILFADGTKFEALKAAQQ